MSKENAQQQNERDAKERVQQHMMQQQNRRKVEKEW